MRARGKFDWGDSNAILIFSKRGIFWYRSSNFWMSYVNERGNKRDNPFILLVPKHFCPLNFVLPLAKNFDTNKWKVFFIFLFFILLTRCTDYILHISTNFYYSHVDQCPLPKHYFEKSSFFLTCIEQKLNLRINFQYERSRLKNGASFSYVEIYLGHSQTTPLQTKLFFWSGKKFQTKIQYFWVEILAPQK